MKSISVTSLHYLLLSTGNPLLSYLPVFRGFPPLSDQPLVRHLLQEASQNDCQASLPAQQKSHNHRHGKGFL